MPLVDAARRNDPEASSVAATDEGKRRVDALRAAFDRYKSLEQVPLAQRRSRSADAGRHAVVAAAAGLIGSVILIVIFVIYLSRVIVKPVRRAAAMAGRVAGGDLSARMPETTTGEIGLLERSFNTMARSLEANRDELRLLAEEQASLRRVATLVSRGASPTDVFDVVVAEVTQLLRANATSLLRYEADGTATVVAAGDETRIEMRVGARFRPEDQDLAATVLRTGRAAGIDLRTFESTSTATALMRGMGASSAVAAPVVVEDHLWGVVIATWTQQEAATVEIQERMAQFSELVATAIANAESRAELSASRARVVAASDETRRRIERDLHDGTQQRLVSLGLELRLAQATVPPGLPELTEELSHVAQGLAAAVEDLQEVSRGIHPAILSRGGLVAALKTLARRSVVPVELDLRADGRLPERIEVAAYYVVSEALTNTAKHARASVVHIDLEATDATINLSIRDDGIGGADPRRGSGLVGLRDRIETLGGSIEVASQIETGTSIVVTIPLPPR